MRIRTKPLAWLVACAAATFAAAPFAASADELPVKVGFAAPLTGANAGYGKDLQNGVQLALDEANAKKIMIGGKTAAWTPNDVFYVELGPKTLGIVRPGHRQFVNRWVNPKTAAEFTPYLKQAQTDSGDADVVFAIDLQDMVGPTAVNYAFNVGELPSLDKLSTEVRGPLMNVLGGAKGFRLKINAGTEFRGELTVDFATDVSAINDHAKEFVIDVLKSTDLYEPTVDAWEFKAKGSQIMGDGPMAPEVLNRLLALLSPANNLLPDDAAKAAAPAGASAAPAATPATPPAAADKSDAAAASQRYFKAVSNVLDTLSPKASPTASATWLVSKARMIEQLPILNVDPDLLAWGNMVAESINRAAQELTLGQQKAKIASMGVASPTGYTTYSENGGGGSDTPETRAAFRNAQDQRRQAAQTERGAAAERALNIFNQILPTRGKIRSDMTQKYGVEF